MSTERIYASLAVLLLASACFAGIAAQASADETIYCDHYITSVPYTISRPGHYCLFRSLTGSMTQGTAIRINADFVWLHLNNFALDGSAAGLSTNARGISTVNHSHITVRNGIVRGFIDGILLDGDNSGGSSYTVENIRADGNTRQGIIVFGPVGGHIVRNNVVTNTGGTTNINLTGHVGLGVVGTATVINNDVIHTLWSRTTGQRRIRNHLWWAAGRSLRGGCC